MADGRQFGSPKILRFGDKTAGNQPGEEDSARSARQRWPMRWMARYRPPTGSASMPIWPSAGPAARCWQTRAAAPHAWRCCACPRRSLRRVAGTHTGPNQRNQDCNPGLSIPAEQHPGVAEQRLAGHRDWWRGCCGAGLRVPGAAASYGNVLPFRRRVAAAIGEARSAQILFQPRFAMTAAMAFFSIALTMNLTGVLRRLRASDLRPSSLKRDLIERTRAWCGITKG